MRIKVYTAVTANFEDDSWDEKIKKDKRSVDEIIKITVPMNHFAVSAEIADAALFLCSNRAKFITDATLEVDGGQTVSF